MPLSDALDQVVADAPKTYGVPVDVELHGYDIFHGRKGWKGVPPRARIAVYKAAMRAIGEHEAAIVLRAVKRAALAQGYTYPRPPHEVVLSHVLERVDAYAASQEEYALVIAGDAHPPAVGPAARPHAAGPLG